MCSINMKLVAFVFATLWAAISIHCTLAEPWPTYSFQNMPRTHFSCLDKILGGYYADAETQCQMFHVCVKLPGVGVQDYRFLCPNGTAFDQETQICANWADVYCNQGDYANGNFDLYRAGGNAFESKREPTIEEEEPTYHLQRAESADLRRAKESKSRPEQQSNYDKQYVAAATARNANNRDNQNNVNNYKTQVTASKKPIVSYYTPTTTTTTSTTERYNDDSKQDLDDIFKGSHSSHFFANRNGGREEDFVNHSTKSKLNDFNEYQHKAVGETTKTRPPPIQRTNRQQTTSTNTSVATTATSTTIAPLTNKLSKKNSLQANYNTDFIDFTPFYRSTTTPASTSSAQTTASSLRTSISDYQIQEKIQPTTYNPNNSIYRLKTTPKYNDIQRNVVTNGVGSGGIRNDLQDFEKAKNLNKPTTTTNSRKSLKQKLGPQESNFVNHQEFANLDNIKLLQPQPFQPKQQLDSNKLAASKNNTKIESQYDRVRGQQVRVGNQEPSPFSVPQKTRVQATNIEARVTQGTTLAPSSRNSNARAMTYRGSITYKATTQSNGEDYAAINGSGKKFSTLVPKEQYTPTTFKPAASYKKAQEKYNYYQSQPTHVKSAKSQGTTAETTQPTTSNPYYLPYNNPDEDDGQYHPELYESDFPRNKINRLKSTTTSPTTIHTTTSSSRVTTAARINNNFQHAQTHLKSQQQSAFQKEIDQTQEFSDEDELFNTAQSLNFGAASINKLRADIYKAEKTSQQYNSQYSPKGPASSTSATASTTTLSTTNIYTSLANTNKPFSTSYLTTLTTRRPTTTTSAPLKTLYNETTKQAKATSAKSTKDIKKDKKLKTKRPAHADADTSYDYAYYDTDTLSESPQEYADYDIKDFVKTHKN